MVFSGIVYCYTSPSGKVYVGQTINEKKRRISWHDRRSDYGGVRVASARRKYYPSLWVYSVLVTVKSVKLSDVVIWLSSLERYYIWLYRACDPKYGYNMSPGGYGKFAGIDRRLMDIHISGRSVLQYDLHGNFIASFNSVAAASRLLGISRVLLSRCLSGKRLFAGGFRWSLRSDGSDLRPLTSEELSLASLSDAELSSWYRSKSHIGLVISPETRRKLSESNKGKKRSASTRALISELAKSRCSSRSYRLCLCKAHGVSGVLQYDLDGVLVSEYACISDAVSASGLTRASIQLSAQGVRLTGGLFQWRYIGSDLPVGPISLSDRVKHRLVDILEYDLDGVLLARHSSVLAAAGGDLRHVRKAITACCDGLRDSYRGRQWRYEGSPLAVKFGLEDCRPYHVRE